MPDAPAAWGIDIGQAGLKAIRLQYSEATRQVLALAFDYVPHAKILSQPDANPEELIAQALDTFLSRNSVRGDKVCISVPGQMALAKFIQLPPVDESKLVEIVKYEARQQIPFALEDVIWDFQRLGGDADESGFMLDAEVGLFAMKKDQVAAQMSPYLKRKVEIDCIQIAPMALYSYLCHDQLGHAPGGDGPENDEYTLVLDMGCDNTMLMVSNGRKIWIRNVPVGGNHFTRALTKEMKLTFAKAEHLKCNATKSPDPKAVFQALRPVFNDYAGEIQRSIGYFSSVNRSAKIRRIVGLGNGFKLAGLQKFLQQNIQVDVDRIEQFPGLVGDAVLNAPLFQEYVLSFGVPYGLALQGLGVTRIRTSLLPKEIIRERMIRAKKPLAVATAAALVVGLAISSAGFANSWRSVNTDRFGKAEEQHSDVVGTQGRQKQAYDAEKTKNQDLKKKGDALLVSQLGKTYWMEVYRAINECLPRPTVDSEIDAQDPSKRKQIRIRSITAQKYTDLGEWFKGLDETAKKSHMLARDLEKPPTGTGYVFRLEGRHFYEGPTTEEKGVQFVRNTLLAALQQWEVQQPGSALPVPVRKLGITHAVITRSPRPNQLVRFTEDPNPMPSLSVGGLGGLNPSGLNPGGVGPSGMAPSAMMKGRGMNRPGGRGPGGTGGDKSTKKKGAKDAAKPDASEQDQGKVLKQSDFVLEFVWVEKPVEKREPIDPTLPAPTQTTTPTSVPAPSPAAPPAATGAQPATPDAAASNTTTPAVNPAPANTLPASDPPAGNAPPANTPAPD